jgi:pilus assembly protein FimV
LAFNKDKALVAAKRYIQKGQIDKAILEYKRIVENDPQDSKNLQRLAELYVRQGSRQEATSVFLVLGDLLIRQGFSNRAISIYKQILQLNPLLIPVYIKLSEIFKTLGLSKDARLFNQRAVEIVQKAGSIEEVYKLLIKIIEIDPEDAISRIALAETCLKLKKNALAIEQFEAALPLLREQHLDDLFIRAAERLLFHKPENVELCRELSILHMNRKEIPKAMKLLLHCRKLDPDDLETLDLLIAHFLSTENNEKAVLVLMEKGKLLTRKGQTSEAHEVLRKVLVIDPKNQEARKLLPEDKAYSWEEVHPPMPPPPPPVPRAASAARTPLDSALHDEIEKKFVDEAEIFIKYGLRQKALEHLFKGLEETGGSAQVREKLKDLYLDVGEINLGIEQLYLLTQQVRGADPGKAAHFLKEILLISPGDARATAMLGSLGPAAAADDDLDEPIPLEHVVSTPPPPVPAAPARRAGDHSFLEEETSDVLEPIERIIDLEEPFLESDFPASVTAAAAISPEELRALDTETPEEISTDDFSSVDSIDIESISSDLTPSEEISSEEISALETETSDFLPALDEKKPAGEKTTSPLEIARGPRAPSIDQVLDEADFFASQGLAQEALVLLEDLLLQYPQHQLIVEKIDELKQKAVKKPAAAPTTGAPDASGWKEEISVSQATDEAIEELGALEKIISPAEFEEEAGKDAVTSTPSEIDAADAQTHHDLGIAYMEMGLWDQAVGEFRIAAQNPHVEAICYNLIGNCLLKAGSVDEAVKEFKMGLFAREKTQDQELNLYYDLATAYVQIEDFKEALYYLQNIKKKNPKYKDVSARVAEITQAYNASMAKLEERAGKRKPAPSTPKEAAKEVDNAFDDLFGDFGKKK